MDSIVNTLVNPAWRIGAVIRSVGGQYVVVCGALQPSRSRTGQIVSMIDALDPMTSVRVFPDMVGADIHARLVVFGDVAAAPATLPEAM